MNQITPIVASILWKTPQIEWKMARKAIWTICSPKRAKFRGKKGFEVLSISLRGLTQRIICYPIAGKYDFSPLATLDFLLVV